MYSKIITTKMIRVTVIVCCAWIIVFICFRCFASLVVQRHAKFTIFPKDFSLSRRDLLRGASATELKKCFHSAEDAEV